MRMRTREGFSVPSLKRAEGGHGSQKGAGKLADSVFARQAQSVRLTADPEGPAKQKR
jgi:hypothetical protein